MAAARSKTKAAGDAKPAKKIARQAAPRQRQDYEIDYRTKTMSPNALKCRTLGHMIDQIPTPARLRAEHRRQGERLVMLRCARCTYFRDIVRDLYRGTAISAKSGYTDGGKDYLVQDHGTGRLSRAAASVAYYASIGD